MCLKIENMTYEEVEEYLKNKSELIIPVGTCEQHGKHMPLNIDTLVAEYLTEYLSDKTGVAIAPTLNYGINLPCDKFLPGTTSLETETLNKFLTNIIEWWESQGFKQFYIITFHGDPFHIEVLSNIKENVVLFKPWEIGYKDILEKQENMIHACEAETSVALYLFPEKVRYEKTKEYDMPIKQIDGFIDYIYHRKVDMIPNNIGCAGYPALASKEKGEKIVRRMEALLLDLYSTKKS